MYVCEFDKKISSPIFLNFIPDELHRKIQNLSEILKSSD